MTWSFARGPTCYVLYKPRGTANLKTDEDDVVEKPLAVLRYEWWRIAWELYFPIVPVMLACVMAILSPLSDTSVVNEIFIKTIVPIGLIGSIWLMADMLLMKEIRLYRDRIVQSYRLFKTREVIFSGATYSFTKILFSGAISIRNANTPWFLGFIKAINIWDLTLFRKADVNQFFSILSEISGRNVEELTSITWKPIKFLKGEIING